MSGLYEIIWQVQTDLPQAARKAFLGQRLATCEHLVCTHEEILDGFEAPEVADLGEELVIWQTLPNGVLAAEGWRKLEGGR